MILSICFNDNDNVGKSLLSISTKNNKTQQQEENFVGIQRVLLNIDGQRGHNGTVDSECL